MSLASRAADDESCTVSESSKSCVVDSSGPWVIVEVGAGVAGDGEAANGLLLDAGGPDTWSVFDESAVCSTPAASPPAWSV